MKTPWSGKSIFSKTAALHIVCLAFLLSIAPASWASPLFHGPKSYNSGAWGASSIAVADVNGDGKPDLLAANWCLQDQRCGPAVLLGNGDGTFQTAEIYRATGKGATSIAVADVNGDGKLDLVVLDAEVSVLLGNGDGTFQAAVGYTSGGVDDASVAVEDVNGDGKLDLVVANEYVDDSHEYGEVSVLLGNGDGTFQSAQIYESGGLIATSIVVADVNEDGKADLLVANSCLSADNCDVGVVGVLLGNGDGTFEAAQIYEAGRLGATSVAMGDVNGDGKPDLVVANPYFDNTYTSGAVSVLLGNGDGTFQGAQSYKSGGYRAVSIVVADVNGDGRPDLLVANERTTAFNEKGRVGVLLGNGDGTFQTVSGYRSGGVFATAIVARDVNGDGKPDLLVGHIESLSCLKNHNDCEEGSVAVLLGTARFVTATTLSSNLNPSLYGQAVTFTATVTSVASTPSGKVRFKDGTKQIGTATLSGGVAKLTTSKLPRGTHPITAQYLGDAAHDKSTSSVLDQVVQ